VIINVRVKTGYKKFSVEKGEPWIIRVKSRAENNRANAEIIKELSKEYGKIRIIRGLKSRNKIMEIE
jgi:uncharacterized protein YggU (UPF0235/DUF167 family)